MRANDGLALGRGELGKRNAKHVHLDAGGDERDDGMHELRNAGCRVQRDRSPDRLDVALGDAMASQEIAGGVGAVHLKALICAGVLRGETHVMEHGAGIEEFGIKVETSALAGKRVPVIDTARMVEQQR